jgi:ribosome-binding factor A
MHDGHLEETIRRILAGALAQEVQDPRIGFVTVSEVRLNRDRMVAEVFYTVLGDEEQRGTTLKGLKSSRGFLRQCIGREVRMRTLPELRFRYDDSLDRSFRLEEILEEVHPASEDSPSAAANDAPAAEEDSTAGRSNSSRPGSEPSV